MGIVVGIGLGAFLAAQTGKIATPKGSSVWMVGTQEQITWTYSGKCQVRLVLYSQNGAKVGVIKSGLQLSAGAYPWQVGQLEGIATVLPPAKGYRIQLKTENPVSVLSISEPFEIATAAIIPPEPPPGNPPRVARFNRLQANPALMTPILRVTKPVDGTQVIPPIICPIVWTVPGSAYAKVNIILTANGQPQWAIAMNTDNDGSFDWKLDGLERTGKYVVRVQTPDGKIHGDSGVVTIAAGPLPPERHVRTVARTPEQMLAKSASLAVKSLDCFYQECGLATVTVKVGVNAVPAVGVTNFIPSPDVGHPQLGSLYLRCRVENPLTSETGFFSMNPGYDRWISLKGGGGSEKFREVYPKVVPGGESLIEIVFDLKPPVPLRGQLVTMKMPGDLFSGGKLCKQYFFPKIIVTVHLITQCFYVSSARMQYLKYSPAECNLHLVALPIEVNSCQEGVQDW